MPEKERIDSNTVILKNYFEIKQANKQIKNARV
jgi:hypothetical protein